MKLGLILLVLAVGSQGFLMTELKETFSKVGDAFKATFQSVGEQAKVVGTALLDQLKQQGTDLLGQTAQSLLLGGLQAFQGTAGTGTKRELLLKGDLQHLIEEKLEQYKTVFNGAIDTLVLLGGESHSADLMKLATTVDEVVHSHHAVANNLIHELTEGLAKLLVQAHPHHKRQTTQGLSDLLGQVGQTLASFFQPHIEAAKQVVNALGQSVKETNQQMPTLHEHVQAMTDSGTQVLQHGQNALSALKDAVTDILHQTVQNVKPHINNILQHAAPVAAQAAGTLVTNLGKHIATLLGAAAPDQ